MDAFVKPTNMFINTERKDFIERQINNPRGITQIPYLGEVIPYAKQNQFDQLYGHPLDLHYSPNWNRPWLQEDFFAMRPIPYTLIATKDKFVDVCGLNYKNKDLPINFSRR